MSFLSHPKSTQAGRASKGSALASISHLSEVSEGGGGKKKRKANNPKGFLLCLTETEATGFMYMQISNLGKEKKKLK